MDEFLNKFICSDWIDGLKSLPNKSVNCCITSPPYFGLRDYGVNGQVGLEATPEEFIAKLVMGFREVHRALRDDGTLWINIGDSYAGYWGDYKAKAEGRPSSADKNGFSMNSRPSFENLRGRYKPKDLIGIPWMLAFAMRADGWYLRQDLIWNKPNPMPESVTDRCTRSHEYVFMFSKSKRYYYDANAIKTPPKSNPILPWSERKETGEPSRHGGSFNAPSLNRKSDKQRGHPRRHAGFNDRWDQMTREEQASMGANKRSVWTVPTKPFREAHFATFPEELVVDMIKAGCPVDGIVLDPFSGAGTTALVAKGLMRNFIAFELNADYVILSQRRIKEKLGLFSK